MKNLIVGIDLGTTFSTLAYVDDEGHPRLVPNAEGTTLTPSVVLIEDGKITVGELAANQAILKKEKVVQWIKREMGTTDYKFCGLTPVEISSAILSKLKNDAEVSLQAEIRRAVVTCPAYFSSVEVENTQRAGELAGLEVLQIVREPVAAAVRYGVDNLKEGERLLVYDLGGGTFDATILQLKNGVFEVLATFGDRQLGGHDWTTDLLEYVVRLLANSLGQDPRDDPAVHQSLYQRCEAAKCDFSSLEHVTITCALGEHAAEATITRQTFEELTEGRIGRTIETCEQVLTKTNPPLSWSQLDKLLLVGGSTRLRRVPEALLKASGKTPIRTGEVDTIVALGAAVLGKGFVRPRHAGITKDPSPDLRPKKTGLVSVKVKESCARHLGTRAIVLEQGAPRIVNSIIIPYGTAIPAERLRDDYVIAFAGQEYFDVPMVEFDDLGPDVILQTYRFKCPANVAAQSRITVTFRYDRSGMLDVEARDLKSGDSLRKDRIEYVEPDLSQANAVIGPRRVVFALDVSFSMGGSKLQRAKEALLSTVSGLLARSPGALIGIVTFGSSARQACPLTADHERIRRAVEGITATGSTRMDEGINEAVRMLEGKDVGVLREIALVTDGMPDHSDQALKAAAVAVEAGIRISAVGIGSDQVDEGFLRRIASGVVMVETADQLGDALPNLLMEGGAAPAAQITWGGK